MCVLVFCSPVLVNTQEQTRFLHPLHLVTAAQVHRFKNMLQQKVS